LHCKRQHRTTTKVTTTKVTATKATISIVWPVLDKHTQQRYRESSHSIETETEAGMDRD